MLCTVASQQFGMTDCAPRRAPAFLSGGGQATSSRGRCPVRVWRIGANSFWASLDPGGLRQKKMRPSYPLAPHSALWQPHGRGGFMALKQACFVDFHEAQVAFKDSMTHGILQFTLPIAFRCVLHRWENLEIRCRKLCFSSLVVTIQHTNVHSTG